jgi:hypothetical protein
MSERPKRDPIRRWAGAIILVNISLLAIVAALAVRALR